jgi:hypothetical protein
MHVFKRPHSPYYDFDFDLGGKTHVKSTRLKNERQALDYAAAYRLKLIKRQVGIIEEEKPRVPTFQEFRAQFDAWNDTQHAGKPGTIKFYRTNYQKLLEFEPTRGLALDRIDEAVSQRFKFWALRKVGRTTVNRYLATLRKGLRYGWRKLKIIHKGPVIEQYQNERQVEYIFEANTYQLLGRPHHQARPPAAGPQTRAQNQPGIDSVLENLIIQSECRYAFSQPRHPDRKLQPWVLESEMGRLRESLTVIKSSSIRMPDFTFCATRF